MSHARFDFGHRTLAVALMCGLLFYGTNMDAAADEPLLQPAAPPPVANWKLLEPFWNSPIVHGESVLFVRDSDESTAANARLLFPVAEIIKVARADGSLTFEEGKDYQLDKEKGVLELTPDSRIPSLETRDLFPPAGSPRSLPHKLGDASRAVLFDNDHWFHDQQVEATYRPAAKWQGYRPRPAKRQLANTWAKLRAKQPLTIGVSGDSISYGYNASGLAKVAPYQPIYPELVAQQLEATFGSPIKLVNRAVGGWRVEQGIEDLPKLLESEPDLVLVAYGMNHVGGKDPAGFGNLLRQLVEEIRAAGAEIILVAPMIGNSNWVHTPREQFGPHRDMIALFAGPGLAVADLTAVWGQMFERKRDCDLTGNGVNHPNDFGHRVYAQAVLGLLLDPAPAARP